ncbi:MAG: T9SS type B sorting domain-containing protein, partial [Flavobacteriales bacterium]
WNFGDGYISTTQNPTHEYNVLGDDTEIFSTELIVTTNNGCDDTISYDFEVYTKPEASFVCPPPNIGFGTYLFESTSLTSGGSPATYPDYNFIWTIQDGSYTNDLENPFEPFPEYLEYQYQNFMITTAMQAILIVENAADSSGNCWDADTCNYNITYWNGLYVPNSLAPGTGCSNCEWTYFLPKGKSLTHYELMIYDKFGNMVFKTTKLDINGAPLEPWDGTKNGIPLPQGTYVWKINAIFSDGSPWLGLGVNDNPNDPYKTIKNEGRKSGAVYLIR